MAHQLLGSPGSLSCSKMLCQRQEEHHSPTKNGQYHSSGIREQVGGGTVSPRLNSIVRELWLWCMNRDITLVAEHLPGVLNTIADEESRVMKDRSDWMLNPRIFYKNNQRWGPLEVDMFASRLTTQLERFFSWRPDPEAEVLDAFNWSSIPGRGYANPPWNLVGRVLNTVRQLQVTLVLVAPVWKSQPWYPILLEMLVDFPTLLPHKEDLIIPSHPMSTPAVLPPLAAWLISGDVTKTKTFQKRAKICSLHHGGRSLRSPMTHCLESGWAGATNGTQIPFQDLQVKWLTSWHTYSRKVTNTVRSTRTALLSHQCMRRWMGTKWGNTHWCPG